MVRENLLKVRETLPEGVTLVAVSKFHPVQMIQEAYDAGQRVFGESREQELRQKVDLLPADIEWHFIGHLQTNKVKYIAPYVSLIHSIDSVRLLDEVERQAVRCQRTINVLLQLHVAQEESKSGFTPDELLSLLSSIDICQRWQHICFRGVMGMASFVDDENQWRREFRLIRQTYQQLIDGHLSAQGITPQQFSVLSFGMSDDYSIAIQEGSNMVRVGTAIFGERNY